MHDLIVFEQVDWIVKTVGYIKNWNCMQSNYLNNMKVLTWFHEALQLISMTCIKWDGTYMMLVSYLVDAINLCFYMNVLYVWKNIVDEHKVSSYYWCLVDILGTLALSRWYTEGVIWVQSFFLLHHDSQHVKVEDDEDHNKEWGWSRVVVN